MRNLTSSWDALPLDERVGPEIISPDTKARTTQFSYGHCKGI